MNRNLTEADLQELDKLINSSLAGSIKEGKQWTKHVKNLYISSRIKRMSDGTLVIKKAGKWLSKFDKLTGIDNYMRKGKDFTRLSTSDGLKQFTDLGDSLLDKLKLVDKNVVLKGSKQAFKESVKGIGKGTLKSAGGALKKSVSFGMNGVVKDAKALVNAKGAGKIVPGLNVALGAVSAGVATFAPVWTVVGAGIIVSQGLNWADKQMNITKNIKSGVNSMIKGVSGWFK